MIPAVVHFTDTSAELAARVAAIVGGRTQAGGKAALPRLFAAGTPIIGICAAGILIRLLAPHLGDKHGEPPVIAIAPDGSHVVPLLGGHHGANRLARRIEAGLSAGRPDAAHGDPRGRGPVATITTASDARFARGLDEPPDGIVLENVARARSAMAAALRGDPVAAAGETAWLTEAGYTVVSGADPLIYHAKSLVAGVGCERGTGPAEVIALIRDTLAENHLSPLALAAIATIDLKADETALHEAASHFGVPLRLFAAADLRAEPVPNPSAAVELETGTPSVAEAAAQKAGVLVVPKHKSRRATCAIGVAPAPLDVGTFGRAPGVVHLVGIGPGAAVSRTAAAVNALDAASDWVGYGLYLDLVSDLRLGQIEHRFALGDEEARTRHAFELAATGRTVALVCSGDAQIYAMAALACELLDASGDRALSPGARRVAIAVHPGISAFQVASAAAGALIGHDFCCISLSDLLTPRETIIRRLEAAADGDFVTALYNPRSRRRTDLLDTALAVFAAHRPSDTPVIVASNVGRASEDVRVVALRDFDPSTVDMLTIVLIGASTSRSFTRGDGRTVAYTPRGYAAKSEAPSHPAAPGQGTEGKGSRSPHPGGPP